MDVANFVANKQEAIDLSAYKNMHQLLVLNYQDFLNHPIDFNLFKAGIKKDKKNIGTEITIIIPKNSACEIGKYSIEGNEYFFSLCHSFFTTQGFSII